VRGTPTVDLHAQLTRADIASAYRYVPIRAGVAVHDWLRRALAKGSSNDVKITVVGDLAQFPFAGKPGQFVFAAKVQDATLDYAEHWPAITNVAADVRIEGTRVAIAATGGRVLGAQISATRAEIADFHAPHPVLRIDGSANGPTSEFLAFIARSPVAEWIGGVTKDAIATGDGRLALQFDLPLREPSTVTINGQYQFASNTINATGVPPLAALTGSLSFTEKDVRTTDLAGEMFGGPLKLQVGHEGGRLRTRAPEDHTLAGAFPVTDVGGKHLHLRFQMGAEARYLSRYACDVRFRRAVGEWRTQRRHCLDHEVLLVKDSV
jgi:uncharacterized protein YhdP